MRVNKIICDNCKKPIDKSKEDLICFKGGIIDILHKGNFFKSFDEYIFDFCCSQCLKEWVEK
jgi:hypothetical protein